MKRVTLLAVGSRGDVEPCIALGLGMVRAGWSVRLAALARFEPAVRRRGLEFFSLGPLPARLSAPGRRPSHWGVAGRALFWAIYQRLLADYLPRFVAACEGATLVVHTGLAFAAVHVAEAMGVPCAALTFVPAMTTEAFVNPLFVRRRLSVHPRWNRATFTVEQQLMLQSTAHVVGRWRRSTLGLPAVPRRHLLEHRWAHTQAVLVAVSPSIITRPPDWSERVHLVGSLSLAEADAAPPDPRLRAFVEGGDAPVYVGFGSMSRTEGARFARATLGALARRGQRGVLATGWGGLAPGEVRDPTVHVVESAPHRWLLPRVAAAVHHGGAGTTTAALRAGVPSVLVPLDYDQRFWARRLADLGVSPEPIPAARFSARRLASALRQVEDPRVRQRLAPLKDQLGREDGVHEAVAVLDPLA